MTKRHKWLPWAAVITGLTVMLVLILAINSEPLVNWFEIDLRGAGPERGLEPDTAGSTTWQNALGKVLISVFILTLVLIHLALLIAAAASLTKPQERTIEARAVCPQCGRGTYSDWRVCPYCGFRLDKDRNRQ